MPLQQAFEPLLKFKAATRRVYTVMESIIQKALDGNLRTVARLIRDIDDGVPELRRYLKERYPKLDLSK